MTDVLLSGDRASNNLNRGKAHVSNEVIIVCEPCYLMGHEHAGTLLKHNEIAIAESSRISSDVLFCLDLSVGEGISSCM